MTEDPAGRHEELVELLENILQTQGSIVLVLQRIYDAYMLQWRTEDRVSADMVLDNHRNDDFLTPLPFLSEEGNDGDTG